MMKMMIALICSPRKPETRPAAMRMITSGLRNKRAKAITAVRFFRRARAFGP